MPVQNLNPYIIINGEAEKAIALYQRALGARVEAVMRFGEAPPCPDYRPEHANLIMHARLRAGNAVLMISDATPDRAVSNSGHVQIALHFDTVDDLTASFTALSDGGSVFMPPQDMFWGSKFAMLQDAFGVQWLLECATKAAEAGKG